MESAARVFTSLNYDLDDQWRELRKYLRVNYFENLQKRIWVISSISTYEGIDVIILEGFINELPGTSVCSGPSSVCIGLGLGGGLCLGLRCHCDTQSSRAKMLRTDTKDLKLPLCRK
jgi:hypothetical protein